MTTNTNLGMSKRSDQDRWLSAIDLMIHNLRKTDSEIRVEAKAEDCLPELLSIRTMFLLELNEMRNEINTNG